MDNKNISWSTIMQSTNDRTDKVRAPFLVAAVIGVHVLAVGAVLFIQGCGTTHRTPVETPPPPPMPPHEEPVPAIMPKAVTQPAVSEVEIPEAAGQTYVVQKGDMLSKIAARNGVSWKEIAELNNIKDPSKIRVGQKLLLPSYAKPTSGSAPSAPKKASAPAAKSSSKAPAKAGPGEYIVQSGDSLSKIASHHGTSVKALREANKLSSDVIRVGQKLTIPGGKSSASAPSEAPASTTASEPAKESAPSPAPAQGSSMPPSPAAVTPDPAPASAPAVSAAPATPGTPSSEVPFEYTVRTGETLDDVARNFAVLKQDIMDLNGITDPASVKAGQKVKIPLSSP